MGVKFGTEEGTFGATCIPLWIKRVGGTQHCMILRSLVVNTCPRDECQMRCYTNLWFTLLYPVALYMLRKMLLRIYPRMPGKWCNSARAFPAEAAIDGNVWTAHYGQGEKY